MTYAPREGWSNKYGIGDYYGTLDCLGNAENGVITLPVADTTGGTFGTGYPGESYQFTISSPSEPAIAVNSEGYRLQMWNTADTTNVLTITPADNDQKTVQNNHGSYINDKAYGFVFKKPATEAEVAAAAGKYLYLKPDDENIVAMQKVYFNGEKSEIKYIHIRPVTQYVTGTVSVDVQTRELVFTPANATSAIGAKVYAWAWQDTQSYLSGEGVRIDMAPASDGTWRCSLAENGANYKVITVNSAGSICDAGSITEQAPKVSLYQSVPGEDYGAYTLTFLVRDESPGDMTLDIGFNEAYAADHLSFTVKNGTYSWTETGVSSTGIYSVEVQGTTSLSVTVKGCYKSVTEGTPMNMTLTATDALGQTSSGSSGDMTVYYKAAQAHTNTGNSAWDPKLGDNGLILTFTQPVRPVDSWAWQESDSSVTGFQTQWEGAFPIAGNGTYTLEFVDIFGQTCTQELTTDAFTVNGKDYSVNLSFSDEGMTKEAVSVTARTPDGFLTFWAGDGSGTIWKEDGVYDTIRLIDENGVEWTRDTSTMSPSDEVYYFKNIGKRLREICWSTNGKMKIRVGGASYAEGNRIFTQTVYIGNIAAAAPAAEVRYFVYALGDEFTQTELEQYIAENKDSSGSLTVTGNVEVWYKTTRTVTPTDGGSQYLFTPENYQDGHTFAYEDELGNTASVHVTLPEGLTLQKPTETVDTTAPSVSVDIYTKVNNTYTQAEAFGPGNTAAEIAQKFVELGYVQGYSLTVNASDASGYDIAVTGDDGAALSGNVVTITKAGTFTITVTDRSSNHNPTSVTFTVPQKIDTTMPVGTIVSKATTLYEKTLTITLTDKDDAGQETVNGTEDTVTLSLPVDAVRIDKNKYTYHITDNGEVTFVFYDQAGNRGTASTDVSGIDTEPPELTVEWSPPHTYLDSEGNTVVDRGNPTWDPVNTNITARIHSDKAMYNLTVQVGNEVHNLLVAGVARSYSILGQDNEPLVTFDVTPELVTVTYSGNYYQELTFTATAPNGKNKTLTLSWVGSIDKTAPDINVIKNPQYRQLSESVQADVPCAVEVTLVPEEPATSPNYGEVETVNGVRRPVQYSRSGRSLVLTFTENGVYNVRFVDEAGNATNQTVDLTEATLGYRIDNTAPKLEVATQKVGNAVEVTVTANEDCKLTWGDTGTCNLTAGEPQTITLTENGTYVFTAEDGASNKSYKTVWVYSIDNVAPSITFTKNTIYVMEKSAEAALDEALRTGYTAWDNVEEEGWPQVSINRSAVDLDTAGQYTVTYTVTDKAGNATTANRFVRVIGKDTVCLKVDGDLILPGSTAVIRPGAHRLALENNDNEPYSIKARQGILSTGQMKYLSGSSLSFDANGNFNVTATGYYTLLVTTQSRQTIRILLYVEQ